MANGRLWTPEEISKLLTYAERTSQQKTAEALGRSWQSVAAKARTLGIRWRSGRSNYSQIAQRVGCSPSTVRRLVKILFPDRKIGYGKGCGRRLLLNYEETERVLQVLEGTRKHRANKIRAGKIRQSGVEETL